MAINRQALIEQVTAKDILRIALLNGERIGSAVRHEGEYIEPTADGFARVYWYSYEDDSDETRTEYPPYMLDAAIDRLDDPIQAAANYLAGVPVTEFGAYEYGD